MAETGDRLKRVREISRSGVATVWEAFDTGLDRKVLIKSIHPQFARDADLRARFEREARAIARLSHPNVVRIYDIRTEAEETSILLEYIEGSSLAKLLKDSGPLPPELAVTIVFEVLAGLTQAHEAGIIHRDLKPENILVSNAGEIKITDFGLATLKDQPSLTMEGEVVGTPSYMAPEQVEGTTLGPYTDVFAVGLILFEMLVGHRLIEGNTFAETMGQLLKDQAARLDEYGEAIPSSIGAVLRRMLEQDPSRRYATAAEAREALQAASPSGQLPRVLVGDFLSREAVRKPALRNVARAQARVRIWRIASGGLLAIALIALTAYVINLLREPATTSQRGAQETLFTAKPVVNSDTAAVQVVPPPVETYISFTTTPVERTSAERVSVTPNDTTSPAAALARTGYLEVVSSPWAEVTIENMPRGVTPLKLPIELTHGKHTVVLYNPDIGFPIDWPVTIHGGDTTLLEINLFDYVARMRFAAVRPWARVYINSEYIMNAPSDRIVMRRLGTHVITLSNAELPGSPVFTDTVTFRQGDSVFDVHVDLRKL